MKNSRAIRFAVVALSALAGLLPSSAAACAACFGQSDSPMAKGMNAGIFALLLVITSVLLGIAIFFAYILRRAARLAATAPMLGNNLAIDPLGTEENAELAVAGDGCIPPDRLPARAVAQSLSQPTH